MNYKRSIPEIIDVAASSDQVDVKTNYNFNGDAFPSLNQINPSINQKGTFHEIVDKVASFEFNGDAFPSLDQINPSITTKGPFQEIDEQVASSNPIEDMGNPECSSDAFLSLDKINPSINQKGPFHEIIDKVASFEFDGDAFPSLNQINSSINPKGPFQEQVASSNPIEDMVNPEYSSEAFPSLDEIIPSIISKRLFQEINDQVASSIPIDCMGNPEFNRDVFASLDQINPSIIPVGLFQESLVKGESSGQMDGANSEFNVDAFAYLVQGDASTSQQGPVQIRNRRTFELAQIKCRKNENFSNFHETTDFRQSINDAAGNMITLLDSINEEAHLLKQNIERVYNTLYSIRKQLIITSVNLCTSDNQLQQNAWDLMYKVFKSGENILDRTEMLQRSVKQRFNRIYSIWAEFIKNLNKFVLPIEPLLLSKDGKQKVNVKICHLRNICALNMKLFSRLKAKQKEDIIILKKIELEIDAFDLKYFSLQIRFRF